MANPFPKKRESFNTLLSVVVAYLVANQTRLTITLAVISALKDKYGDVTTAGTYLYLYSKWADVSGGRTKDIITSLTRVERELKVMLAAIYDDIPGSVWTDSDRNTLRRKRGLPRTYTHHTSEIIANTFMRHKLIGASKIKISCFAAEDSTRPSINKSAGANSIQLAICIISPNNIDTLNELAGKVRKEAPKSVEECPYREIHLKAMIPMTFEAQYSNCKVYIYARQFDVRHPELAGPWSNALIITIP
jgi:hypothetical protein